MHHSQVKRPSLLERKNHPSLPIVFLIFNNPQRGNALNSDTCKQVISNLETLEADPFVRAVVITGKGRFFCTGMDLGKALQENNGQSSNDGMTLFLILLQKMKHFPKPLVVVMNGPALGGGVGIVAAADIRFASQRAYVALPEVRRGLVPAIISPWIVSWAGKTKAKEWMLRGHAITALDLLSGGLISGVFEEKAFSLENEPNQLPIEISNCLRDLTKGAPNAQTTIKKLVSDISGDSERQEKVKEVATKVFKQMMISEEAKYGISCFKQKLEPNWTQYASHKVSKEQQSKL